MPWMCCAALLALAVLGGGRAAAETTLRLRIAWGGGAERIWRGSVRLSEGQFSELQALGIEANEPGSIWLTPEGITIREPGQRAYDGVDVLVTANLDAMLTVSLSNDATDLKKSVEIPLWSTARTTAGLTLLKTGCS